MTLRTAGFFVSLGLLAALTACDTDNLSFSEKPPSSTQTPPLYPGATQITTQNLTHFGGSARQISFETSAKSEAVMDFYRTSLASDGWVISDLPTPIPNQHRFLWARNDRNPSYELDLLVSSIADVQTHVVITSTEDVNR
jgi:hypothetical protein